MCQGHWRFDVQVVRRQGGAGLPSAGRLALAGSTHALARPRRPAGLSGCGFPGLCWKVPGLLGKPGAGAGLSSDPESALSSSQSTGWQVTFTTTSGLDLSN